MGVAALVVSSLLGLVGLYLTHSLRRQHGLKVAEQRLAAYRPLWELTEVARRSRWSTADGSGALTREGRLLRTVHLSRSSGQRSSVS